MKHIWRSIAAFAALLILSLPAPAAVICAGCEYDESGAGSYLGAFNGLTHDLATFTHTGVGRAETFEDFWVFDLTPASIASASADFTVLAPIFGFFGELYRDDGSTCAGFVCSDIVLGELLARAEAGGATQFSIDDALIAFLPEGRYILRIGGIPNSTNQGAYSGQVAFFGFGTVREAGTLGLFGMGLLAFGLVARRRR